MDGLVGKEAKVFLDLLADKFSLKWGKPYSCVVHWLRAKMSFALLRATDFCIRGKRSAIRERNVLDGAIINPDFHD